MSNTADIFDLRDMSFMSDYFRRDARRYDNGFELY